MIDNPYEIPYSIFNTILFLLHFVLEFQILWDLAILAYVYHEIKCQIFILYDFWIAAFSLINNQNLCIQNMMNLILHCRWVKDDKRVKTIFSSSLVQLIFNIKCVVFCLNHFLFLVTRHFSWGWKQLFVKMIYYIEHECIFKIHATFGILV